MTYSDFTLEKAKSSFELNLIENLDLFSTVSPVIPSSLLAQTLSENVFLASAISTEKARSELIIAPILLEVKRQTKISFFSGIDFNVAPEKGLSGFVDFILSKSPEQYFIQTPIITLVEAKNENIKVGLGQCVAEMVAADIFNQHSLPILGVVTTGQIWKFLKLEGQTVSIDVVDYYIDRVDKILGILISAIQD